MRTRNIVMASALALAITGTCVGAANAATDPTAPPTDPPAVIQITVGDLGLPASWDCSDPEANGFANEYGTVAQGTLFVNPDTGATWSNVDFTAAEGVVLSSRDGLVVLCSNIPVVDPNPPVVVTPPTATTPPVVPEAVPVKVDAD